MSEHGLERRGNPVHEDLPRQKHSRIIADQSRTARRDEGACAACGHMITSGQRLAVLTDGTGSIHASCAAQVLT